MKPFRPAAVVSAAFLLLQMPRAMHTGGLQALCQESVLPVPLLLQEGMASGRTT